MSGRAAFSVPSDEVRWCAALAKVLSTCCHAPSSARVAEARALLNAPPLTMLPMAWHELMQAASSWLPTWAMVPGEFGSSFGGARLIEAALKDKPVPVPAWADWFK